MKKLFLLPAFVLAVGLGTSGCSSDEKSTVSPPEVSSVPSETPSDEASSTTAPEPSETPPVTPTDKPDNSLARAGYYIGDDYLFKIPADWKPQKKYGAIDAFYLDEKTGDSVNVIVAPSAALSMDSKGAFEKKVFKELTSTGLNNVSKISTTTIGGKKAFAWTAEAQESRAAINQLAVTDDGRIYVITVGSPDRATAAENYNTIVKSWEWK